MSPEMEQLAKGVPLYMRPKTQVLLLHWTVNSLIHTNVTLYLLNSEYSAGNLHSEQCVQLSFIMCCPCMYYQKWVHRQRQKGILHTHSNNTVRQDVFALGAAQLSKG